MMFQLRHAAVMVLFTVASTSQVSPVEKVINLLQGLKDDVVKEAKAEAGTYDKFACFCKDTTVLKSTSVTEGQDNIDKLSASIAENTATRAADVSKVQGLKTRKEELSADLETNTVRCAKEKAEYEAIAADFSKAISSLKNAIKTMGDKKDAIGKVSALQAVANVNGATALLENVKGLRETLDLADAMGLIKAPKQKAFLQGFSTSLLQQDAKAPEYEYHSSDIVDLLLSLKKDFTEEKATLDTEHGKSENACTALKASLAGKIETNGKETKTTDGKISKLSTDIADARGSLVEAQDLMKDDEQYLKDLTNRCEARAVDWDQRSSMREGEIKAISTALSLLGDKVKDADAEVNKRALLQKPETKATPAKKEAVPAKKEAVAVVAKAAPKAVDAKQTATSFLQRVAVSAHSNELSQEALEQIAKDQVVTALKNEGSRLQSPILSALAMQVAADPFKKVKNLIQGLIERLIRESAGEATKKGFCDTELGKARNDRDFRWNRVKKLTAQIQVGTAKEDALTEEIASLTKSLTALEAAMKDAIKMRKEEKEQNGKTLETARGGLEAVNEAILILRSFYKSAAKAAVLLQASPVDEDTAGAGFSGAYQGKQQSSNAVVSLLETIASDFERTVRTTEASEDEASKEFVQFQRTTKVDIGGKTTKKELDTQDLETTKQKLKVDRADMQTNMDLVDDAVKTLMELKPTCVDSGMSYKERVQKREEEVAALKKAVCILDTEKVEADCK